MKTTKKTTLPKKSVKKVSLKIKDIEEKTYLRGFADGVRIQSEVSSKTYPPIISQSETSVIRNETIEKIKNNLGTLNFEGTSGKGGNSKITSRKDLGDYQKSEEYKRDRNAFITVILVVFGLCVLLYAMHADQQALNAGLIH